MSDRALRGDNRAGHHDGVDRDPAHRPGPCRVLDPKTMKPIEPPETTRIFVDARDEEAARAALEAAGSLSFEQQKEEVRRLNSIMLARVGAKVLAGNVDDDTILALLTRTSVIAKQWATEERQAGGNSDPDDIDALKRAARKAG